MNVMVQFSAKQKCNACGSEFYLTYHVFKDGDRNQMTSCWVKLENKKPCTCIGSFSPCEGVPTLDQWFVETVKGVNRLPHHVEGLK
ncbi:hypothetical protein AN963_09995 [Brevibacillus choshinensis]|uniref:Uncharacterized protein n=1 Tax=Brevibacillus choshinensis TaxID=54911 RepID=A0ABR5NEM3_BRECH|nr:hypothetical protein [Brevibacillus choshinensis]KQL49985.1 hypothetical protein AN963_09995 [Brevibacillus choshinensis]